MVYACMYMSVMLRKVEHT